MLSVIMLSVIMLSVIMPSVFMLSVIMLSVIMLSVIMLSVIMLNDIMLSVIMLSVIMLIVMEPTIVLSFVNSERHLNKTKYSHDFKNRFLRLEMERPVQNKQLLGPISKTFYARNLRL
jgi:hypothetical protein